MFGRKGEFQRRASYEWHDCFVINDVSIPPGAAARYVFLIVCFVLVVLFFPALYPVLAPCCHPPGFSGGDSRLPPLPPKLRLLSPAQEVLPGAVVNGFPLFPEKE